MPRKESFPPKPHKHRGRARCRYLGQEYYLGAWGSPEADRAYRELIGRLACAEPAALLPPTASPTVADLAAAYLAEQERTRGNRLELYLARRALTVLLRLHGHLRAADYGCRQIEELQAAMASGNWMTDRERAARLDPVRRGKPAKSRKKQQGKPVGPRPLGWCLQGVNHAVCRVRSAFYWAERKGLVPRGTAQHLRLAPALTPVSPVRARLTPRRPAATEADVLKVAQECVRPAGALLLLLWWTGARPGELCILRTCDVDRSGAVWLYRPGSDERFGRHKNAWRGHDRLIALGPEAQAVLVPLLAPDRPEEYVFRPSGKNATLPHYTPQRLLVAVRRASRRAGVRGLTPYSCRHGAKRRIAAALGTEAAKNALGHKDSRTTDGYGAGVDVDLLVETARKCG